MLERREGLADRTQHHTQEIQGIRPHVSARPSDQSTQLGHLPLSEQMAENYTSVQCSLYKKFVFFAGIIQIIYFFNDGL
jgi:hypothetical protein